MALDADAEELLFHVLPLSPHVAAHKAFLYGSSHRGHLPCGEILFRRALLKQGWGETREPQRAAFLLGTPSRYSSQKHDVLRQPLQLSNADVDDVRYFGHKRYFSSAMSQWQCSVLRFHPRTVLVPRVGISGDDTLSFCAEIRDLAAVESPGSQWVVKEASLDIGNGNAFTHWDVLARALSPPGVCESALVVRMRLEAAGLFNHSAWKKYWGVGSGPTKRTPSLLLQRLVQPPLLLNGARVSSRDYVLLLRAGNVSLLFHHRGYVMRCVTRGCAAPNLKDEAKGFRSDEQWAPYRFDHSQLERSVPAAVAVHMRASHDAARRHAARALLARLRVDASPRPHWLLFGADTVFDDSGNANVLEFNHSPELFCHAFEGAARRENNQAVVTAAVSVLTCVQRRLSEARIGASAPISARGRELLACQAGGFRADDTWADPEHPRDGRVEAKEQEGPTSCPKGGASLGASA